MKTSDSITSLMIAVVEDNEALLSVTLDALQKAGNQICGFASAEAFLMRPSYVAVDVVIIDINLPGEDGFILAKRFRATSPQAGIIMVTARTTLNDRMIGYETGADIYLPKPVYLEELVSAVNALGRRIRSTFAAVDDGLSSLPQDLPPRLLQIAQLLLSTAMNNREIAGLLGLHEGTVRKHIERLYRMLSVNSRAELSILFRANPA